MRWGGGVWDLLPIAVPPSRRGATSVVYSCEEKGTRTPYAAKILKKTVSVGGTAGLGV